MLRRGDGDTRLTSLRVSLDISLNALGAESAAHRLLRLIALLPVGMAAADCVAALADGAPIDAEKAAAAKLEAARLAGRRDDRWRLLAPVRETLLQDYPPQAQDKARLVKLFLARAALGWCIGRAGWDEVRESVTAEAGNFDAMIKVASIESTLPDGLARAAIGLANLHRFTGLASVASLREVAARLGRSGDARGQADCIRVLGEIALDRCNYGVARTFCEAALSLYRKIGDMLGEANCIKGFGDIALRCSDLENAGAQYEMALPLYRAVGEVLSVANCIFRLGEIAFAHSDYATARAQYVAARPLCCEVGDVLGEANCIASLGHLALARSDYEVARAQFQAALPLFRRIGAVAGEANCIQCLGNIALRRSDYDSARDHYEAALKLHRRVGDVLGEANCIEGLGEVALRRSNRDEAREHFDAALPLFRQIDHALGAANCIQGLGDIDAANNDIASARDRWSEALALYGRIANHYQIGGVHNRLARRAATAAEAAAHREAARRAWASIGRADLIANFLDKAP